METELNFEASIKELEEIVTKLEKGEQSLDEMLALFERGIGLSRNCSTQLEQAEAKINVLVKKGEGIEKQPFGKGEGTDQ